MMAPVAAGAIVNAMTHRRGGLLPRQRRSTASSPRSRWDAHREPRRAPTPSGCSSSSTSAACAARSSSSAGSPSGIPALVRAIAGARPRDRVARLRAPAGLRPDAGGVPRRRPARESAARRTSGVAVRGYRAPSYSITPRSLWALDVLIEEGYRYDASIFPIRHDRYGIPGRRRATRTSIERARRRARRSAGSTTVRSGR